MAPGPHGACPLSTCWRPSIRLLQPFFPATISREILMGCCFICPSPSTWPVFLSPILGHAGGGHRETDSCGTCLPRDTDSYEYGKHPDHPEAVVRILHHRLVYACRALNSGVWSLDRVPPRLCYSPTKTTWRWTTFVYEYEKSQSALIILLMSRSRQHGRGLDRPSKRSHEGVAPDTSTSCRKWCTPLGYPGISDPPSWYRTEGHGHGCIVISHRESES